MQGEVFFAALDTCWPSQRVSAGICTPESYSLMPSPASSLRPPPRETLEVVCSCTATLGHRITQGGSGKQRGPAPFPRRTPPPGEACFPARGTSQRSMASWVGLAFHSRQPRQPVRPELVHRSRAHSEWKHVLACGCVFSHADGPFSPVPPCIHQAAGPAPSSSSHSRWEQTSHWQKRRGVHRLPGESSAPPSPRDAEWGVRGLGPGTSRGHACLTKALTGV